MGNVYYDTAASLFLYQDDIFSLAARWAPGKVLFATDFPLITPRRFLKRMRAARMPTATRRRMLGGNAWRVLRLGERLNPGDPWQDRGTDQQAEEPQPAAPAAATHQRGG